MRGLIMASGGLDATAIAAIVLAGIMLALAAATIALVLATRAGTAQARADARAELRVLERQVRDGYRPLLVDVLLTAPAPPDMGRGTKLPGIDAKLIDPRSVFVKFERHKIYLSVPLRNVGRGLAMVDGNAVELTGPMVGSVEHRTVQREHVPVGETTRVELIAMPQAPDVSEQDSTMRGITWQLAVPYCDFAREQWSVAQLQIVCRDDDVMGPWVVVRVEQEFARDQESARDQEPRPEEWPDRGTPARSDARPQRRGVRGEPVVDLWGNPISPRRRKR